jgi:ubiquinone/menaquinone biosynthesis C-methylase UbiE
MAEDRKEWQNPEEIIEQINVAEGSSIVDLGCGPGFFTIPFTKKLGMKGRVYAVDSDPIMLNHLSTNLEGIPPSERSSVILVESDVTDTKIPDHSVDLVFFANVLHDLEDPKKFFTEAARILKADGKLVDIDWEKLETNEMGPPMEWRLSENDSRRHLRENGFRVNYALNAGPYHYGFLCRAM